jgi:hypothetical protein
MTTKTKPAPDTSEAFAASLDAELALAPKVHLAWVQFQTKTLFHRGEVAPREWLDSDQHTKIFKDVHDGQVVVRIENPVFKLPAIIPWHQVAAYGIAPEPEAK